MADRVRFDKPPVVEVVCGALFGSLPAFRVAHVGRYWELVKEEFPIADEAPPLDPIIEAPDGRQALLALEFELSQLPPAPRSWLRAKDESALIQIQRDRFLYNWKRSDCDQPYPSYDNVIVDFERHFRTFADFAAREQLGSIAVRQLELTYVNHIPTKQILAGDPVFIDHQRTGGERFLPEPISFNWKTSYPLPNGTGRLHVTMRSARALSTGEPLLRMDMTARGIGEPTKPRAWFDLAHEWIVRGFADITTAKMQKDVWRRIS